uniref:DOG1 domain-containing protein n=1 Tax=Kalanchoe fedtschenkoi TaxID=63787 RepID=A0A7N0VIQ7_KALFE
MRRPPSSYSQSLMRRHSYLKEHKPPRNDSSGQSDAGEGDDVASRVQCLALYKRDAAALKKGEELSWEKYGLWRQEQKARAARLEKQLRARWELEELIDEQLKHYHAHYNTAMVPFRLKDVAQLLMPQWAPPQELASLAWFGDWRPSAILDLLRALLKSESFPFTSSLSDSLSVERLLSELIREIRIEESVIDEEMTEIQATCVIHLPFSPIAKHSCSYPFDRIQYELKKIEKVILKAHQLRFKALELIVKKLLCQTDAAEFVVTFAGIQDTLHNFAVHQSVKKSPVAACTRS